MWFGEIDVADAAGAILGHSIKHQEGLFKKGRLLSASDIALLKRSDVAKVFAAKLGPEDIHEDEAASMVAQAIAGAGSVAQEPFTGRANLHAENAGVAVADGERVRALNRLHESLTLATVANYDVVEARQMVATVKVIPFAVPRPVVEEALAIIGNEPLIRVEAFRHFTVGLVITRQPQTKPSIIAKSEQSIRDRIEALGGTLGEVIVADHKIDDVAKAIIALQKSHHHPILIFGASAIVDRGDVIPAAVVKAGGEVVHLGMPVDPGNLMMFGRAEGVPVIGVPSCARSPKINGFDWVLARVMAGIHVSAYDIMDMGAGGLLKEIPTRPSPREAKPKVQAMPRIAAVVLAAGRSTRMGANKLLADVRGEPMIRRSVEAIVAAKVAPVLVVTGHDADKVRAALNGMNVRFVHNPDYAEGLSTSLIAGIRAVPPEADGAVICLGDMPLVEPRQIDKLVSAFNPAEGRTICMPVHDGQRGNPVLWGRQHFDEMMTLTGDSGAKRLIDRHSDEIVEVPASSSGVLTDIDTPQALKELAALSL
jgi:molybdenum cofactor cytidylyltransferase